MDAETELRVKGAVSQKSLKTTDVADTSFYIELCKFVNIVANVNSKFLLDFLFFFKYLLVL